MRRASVPKPPPLQTSARAVPGVMESRIACMSAVICRASISIKPEPFIPMVLRSLAIVCSVTNWPQLVGRALRREHVVMIEAHEIKTLKRLIGSLRRECLDWFIPLSEKHLRMLVREWARPHLRLGPGIPDPPRGLPVKQRPRRHIIPANLLINEGVDLRRITS
jgi:hypothetical protein